MGFFTGSVASFGPLVLTKSSVKKTSGKDKGEHPLDGVTASVETGEELHRRVTATRVVLTGPFALLLRKRAGGTSYLTVEGPGFAWVEEVGRKDRGAALGYAAQVRGAVAAQGGHLGGEGEGAKPSPRRVHPSRR